MPEYTIDVQDGPVHGIQVTCTEHGEREEFPAHYRTIVFSCSECGVEMEVNVRDTDDWRAWDERC